MLSPQRSTDSIKGQNNISPMGVGERSFTSDRIAPYLMLLPYLLGLCGLVFLPALVSLGLAFTEYDALTPWKWIAFDNFERLWHDTLFWLSVGNTALYISLAVVLRTTGALMLALLLRGRYRGATTAQLAIYSSTAIPEIAYALLWLVAFNPRFGPINRLLTTLYLPAPNWVIEPWPALWALIIMAAWQLGEGFIVLLISVNATPISITEACRIDGATTWQGIRYVIFPLLMPTLLLLVARDLIFLLQTNFVPSLVVTKGGPGYATLFIPLYTYILAFDELRFGYAASLVWVVYLLLLLIVFLQFMLARRWQFSGELEQ